MTFEIHMNMIEIKQLIVNNLACQHILVAPHQVTYDSAREKFTIRVEKDQLKDLK
jgi:hypothetical protein